MKQTLKYIYDRLEEQLRYAETKHSISIALASALAVFCATFLSSASPVIRALSGVAALFSLVSVIYSFLALSAKSFHFKAPKGKKRDGNLLYFKEIASYSPEDYALAIAKTYPLFKGYTPDNFDLDLARQVVATAKAIKSKFLYFNFAIVFLILSLISECVVIFLRGV